MLILGLNTWTSIRIKWLKKIGTVLGESIGDVEKVDEEGGEWFQGNI